MAWSLGGFDGKVAVVTGAGRMRSIGRPIAVELARAGANVVLTGTGRDPSMYPDDEKAAGWRDIDSVADEVRAHGVTAVPLVSDVSDEEAVHQLAEQIVERFGRIDIVVNNAANALRQDFGEFTAEAWEKSFAVNLRGPVFLVQEALPYLEKSPNPAVVNVISAAAFLFSPFQAMYGAGKAALLHFTRSMAAEFAPRGIRVNALAPGTVDTDMVRNNTPEMQQLMAGASLMKRAADPEEMVGPVLFLASDAASFVTGQVLIADGGLVSR